MNNNSYEYNYIDKQDIYILPNKVLKNKLGITDQKELNNAEALYVGQRLAELRDNPIQIKNTSSLFEIHHQLFQDLYEWAGKTRTIEISKPGTQFSPTSRFDQGIHYIDKLITDYRKTNKNDKTTISKKLAIILDYVNYLHPFREGNGRTQREFIYFLAKEKGYTLDLNPPDN